MVSQSNKPTWRDTADYFQQQADRTRDPDRKAHYQRCADECRAAAAEQEQKEQADSLKRPDQ
jgi:hypothetical protein